MTRVLIVLGVMMIVSSATVILIGISNAVEKRRRSNAVPDMDTLDREIATFLEQADS